MSKVIRSVKNVTKGYSSVQVKVREGALGANMPAAHWHCRCTDRMANSHIQRPVTTHGARQVLR